MQRARLPKLVDVETVAQKRKPGWFARFLLASSWMRLHRSAARLALSLPLAGLGPVRSPGMCFLRPILKRRGARKQTAGEMQTRCQAHSSSTGCRRLC